MSHASVTAGEETPTTLDSGAFHRFLNWLDEGSDSEGRSYLEMRCRLVAYFDRKNCLSADELADETLSRVSRRLAEEGAIVCESPAKYCYIVARFVFLEYLRAPRNTEIPIDDSAPAGRSLAEPDNAEERQRQEKMLDCLEKCASELKPTDRDLIVSYYQGRERTKIDNRRDLAASLGITANALGIRACRIRDKLEACVSKCMVMKGFR